MPLAERRRAVAVQAQHFRQRSRGIRYLAGRPRKARRHLGDKAHVDSVMVASGFERCPSRRAQRGRVKVVIAQSVLRQSIERRRRNRPTECAGGAKAQVVDQYDHDIRRTSGCLNLEGRWHLYVAHIEFLIYPPLRLRNWQHRAIDGSGRCGFLLCSGHDCRHCQEQHRYKRNGPITPFGQLFSHRAPCIADSKVWIS